MAKAYQHKLAQLKDREHPFAPYVRILGKGKTGSRSLSGDEAFTAMRMILAGEVEDLQLGAFLMLLRVKEESAEELCGFVRAAREHIDAPVGEIAVDLDWSSYAGKKRQLPWFLLSCFALADQGVRVFMHGASGHTMGRLYTDDVLRQLNIPTASNWDDVKTQLQDSQFSFMPLEVLSPELKRIMDFRNYLGLRSPVHTLSRLLNPLAADYSMQSIFHPSYADSHQRAALTLNQPHAAVFKGEGGEIERKPEAVCTVKRVDKGNAFEQAWPRLLEGRQLQPEHLDIDALRALWRGGSSSHTLPHADTPYAEMAVIGTLAIALELLGKAPGPEEAMVLAREWWQQRNRDRL